MESSLAEKVAVRYLLRLASEMDDREPAINKKKDRIVYVLPETLDEEGGTYEPVPKERAHHLKYKGKPRHPDKPAKPEKPHKPDIPRATTPAELHPPKVPKPLPPIPKIPQVKPVPHLKSPMPTDEPRRWKTKAPKPST